MNTDKYITAPTAQNKTAQGNALGYDPQKFSKP